MTRLFLTIIIAGVCTLLQAQTRIENVEFKQGGNNIIVTYDLYSIVNIDAQLFYTIDNGVSWHGPLNSLTGDINDVQQGTNKSITWNVLKDQDWLISDNIKFKVAEKEKEVQLYKIETEFGDMVFKLYDQTPLHKENFKKLIEQGYFNELLFHRVIDGFVIQGGDPDSRNAEKGVLLGNGGPGYTVPAEFVDTIFHKKGVIASVREGDDVNPEMRSAGSQFYIVQGKVFNDDDIKQVEARINSSRLNKLITKYIKDAEEKAYAESETHNYPLLVKEAREKAEKKFKKEGMYKIPKFKRKVYQTIGGIPHFDGAYTVFGEVIEGLDVIDKISVVKTDENDRPIKNVKMKIKKL